MNVVIDVLLGMNVVMLINKVLRIKIIKFINIDEIVGIGPSTIKLDNFLIIPIQTGYHSLSILTILYFF